MKRSARMVVGLLLFSSVVGVQVAPAQSAARRNTSLWRRADRGEAFPAPPDAVVVDFGPVGYIAGRPTSSLLHVHTPYARLAIQPEHLALVEAGYATNRVTLTFRNGDAMERVALLDPLRLDTELGPVTLDPALLARSQPAPDRLTVAVQLCDGTHLTGEPEEGEPRRPDGSPLPWAGVLKLEAYTNAPGRFSATTTAGGTETDLTLSSPFRIRGPFGTLMVPGDAICRVLVLAAAKPGEPETRLGNVAAAEAGAVARAPQNASRLNDGDWQKYDTSRGWAGGPVPCDISVRFPRTYTLSFVRFLLWDRDRRSYRYTVEVSPDGNAWETLADRSDGWWRSWQSIAFAPRPVRAIRVRGLSNSVSSSFDVVELEAYCHEPASGREPLWTSGVPDESAERLTPRPRDRPRRHRPGGTK